MSKRSVPLAFHKKENKKIELLHQDAKILPLCLQWLHDQIFQRQILPAHRLSIAAIYCLPEFYHMANSITCKIAANENIIKGYWPYHTHCVVPFSI
jgi:hypothetical protein